MNLRRGSAMILHASLVEQAVNLGDRGRFVKELVITRVRRAAKDDVPLAMIRKRRAGSRDDDLAGETLAPVLLVHGYGQNRYAWHLPARSLSGYLASAGFDVYNLELRGHGRSRRLGAHGPRAFDEHVREDVPAAIEEIQRISGGRGIYYIGHSMGGIIGYAAAASLSGALAGMITLGSPYHFARGSWVLSLAGHLLLALDRCVPLERAAPPLWPIGRLMRLFQGLVESPYFPLPVRGFAPGSMEPLVLGQHLSLAMDAGSLPVLKYLFRTGFEVRRRRDGTRTDACRTGAFEGLDLPLLVIGGSRDDLAPLASVMPAFEESRSRDKTYRVFPHGHIDLIMGRDAPLTVWPLIEAWMLARCASAR